MVLGLRSKNKKGGSVQVDFIIYVEDLKPWPPSQSLKSVQSVLFVWENGEQSSGSFASDVGDASVQFNESITLRVTLCRDRKAQDKFQKKFLDFYLYEPRKDKASRGQLLGTCVINLADFGATEKAISICTPVNCKKSSKSSEQPSLFITIHSFHSGSSNSSPKVSLSKEKYIDEDGQTSVADSLNEEINDGCEIATFTDDDASSHSSHNASFSTLKQSKAPPSQHSMDGVESLNKSLGRENIGIGTISGLPTALSFANISGRDVRTSDDNNSLMSSDRSFLSAEKNPTNDHSSYTKFPERSMTSVQKISAHPVTESSSSFTSSRGTKGMSTSTKRWAEQLEFEQDDELLDEVQHLSEMKLATNPSQDAGRKSNLRSDSQNSNKREHALQSSNSTNGKLKHSKSNQPNNVPNRTTFSGGSHSTEKTALNKSPNGLPDRKNEWKLKAEMLEEELRETAVLEVSLYSVVADHTNSSNKIHAPARRLSRFYLQACKMKSRAKQASSARAAIAGLVLVSKACGNDVPRLTFWLSNSIMLRAIVSQSAVDTVHTHSNTGKSGSAGRPLKQRDDFVLTKESKKSLKEEYSDWEDVTTFVLALEQLEAWIFSRIVESVWWQTLTPHMQSSVATTSDRPMVSNSKKGRKPGLGEQEQCNFSIELWKKAFKDACERLCPVRAGGHECGCLPVMAKLIMEQLVSRLDVAMLNAILRESDDEMPTDPVSDPISDARVLPIPAGKSSFGAGAQLKNAIGNWSRWLSNLFGIEENDPPDSNNILMEGKQQEPKKPFRLLNELSDLMMLPFDMVADPQTRKEVCPTFSPTLIKRNLSSFVPDEFYQKPVPQEVFDALDIEDDVHTSGECLVSFPCSATPIVYSSPHAASVSRSLGDVGSQALSNSGSSVLKKSYTSDDELDELDSPLTCIMADRSRGSSLTKINWSTKGKGGRSIVRYQLLREVWRDDEQ